MNLYAKARQDPLPGRTKGLFANVRLLALGLLFALYFGTAWLDWGGASSCCLISGSAQFHIFCLDLSSREDFFLALVLTDHCAFGLFYSRVCRQFFGAGYTCPTDGSGRGIFMWALKG